MTWRRLRRGAVLGGLPVLLAAGCTPEPAPSEAEPVAAASLPLNPGCIGSPMEIPGTAIWANNYGDAWYQRARQVEVDPFGDILVTGYFNGSIDFGNSLLLNAGGEDAWLGKFTPAGAPVWSASWGSAGVHPLYARGIALAIDGVGNIFLTGLLTGNADFGGGTFVSAGSDDIFITKRAPDGLHLWSKLYGDAGTQYVQAVEVDANGDLFVLGYFDGTIDMGTGPMTSAGGFDAFIAKLDGATGAGIWAHQYGDSNYQDVWDFALDAAGGVTFLGNFGGTVDFGGGPKTTPTPVDYDAYVVHLDSAGNHIWSQSFSGVGIAAANSLVIDSAGNRIFSGSFQGTMDFGGASLTATSSDDVFLVKLDPFGNPLWQSSYPGNDFQRAVDMAVDAFGNVTIAGRLKGSADFGGGLLTSAGDEDAFIAQYGPTGNHLWSKIYGDDQIQGVYGVTLDANADIIVTGRFNGSMDFGSGPLVTAGNRDIFLAKITGARCAEACTGQADGAPCDDANPCTQSDACQAGLCAANTPIVCAASDLCHVAGVCDPLTGTCDNPAKVDGAACDDGDSCTQSDTCQAGVCTGDNPVFQAARARSRWPWPGLQRCDGRGRERLPPLGNDVPQS